MKKDRGVCGRRAEADAANEADDNDNTSEQDEA